MKKVSVLAMSIAIFALAISFGITSKSKNDFNRAVFENSGFGEYRPLPKCRIEVSDAYLQQRTRGFSDEELVAVEVISSCNQKQENVQIDLEIWKVGTFFNHKIATFHTNPRAKSSSGYVVHTFLLGVPCKNSKKITYFGIASSIATIQGKRKETPRVMSMSPKSFSCGS
jgi:hypothetical protein